jgi:hypothetical protein
MAVLNQERFAVHGCQHCHARYYHSDTQDALRTVLLSIPQKESAFGLSVEAARDRVWWCSGVLTLLGFVEQWPLGRPFGNKRVATARVGRGNRR